MNELEPVVSVALAALQPLSPANYPRDAHPAALYLTHQQGTGRKSMKSTVEHLAQLVPGDFTVETVPWHQLRYQHTQQVWSRLHDSGMKPATVKKYLAALRGVLRECRKLGYMTTDEYERAIDLPKVRGESLPAGRSLTATEVGTLIAACACDRSLEGVRDLALLHTITFTGMRLAEIMNLPVEATGEAVKILGKGNVEREGFLPADSVAAVDAWLKLRGAAPGPLFLRVAAGKATPDRLSETVLRSVLKRRGLEAGLVAFTPHDLRRTFATQSLDTGTDIAVVKRLMGHKSVRTTERYDRRGASASRAAVGRLAEAYGLAAEHADVKISMPELFSVKHIATPDDIHRGYGAYRLQTAIDGGFISCTTVQLIEEDFELEFLKQFSGGEDHRKLCAVGARWIEAKGLLWSARRNQCKYAVSGIADVMSTDHTLAVECGISEPSKIVVACPRPEIFVLYIPFYWRMGLPRPYGFLFERTAKVEEPVFTAVIEACCYSEDAWHARDTFETKTKRGTLTTEEREKLLDTMYTSLETVVCDHLGCVPIPYNERTEERNTLKKAYARAMNDAFDAKKT